MVTCKICGDKSKSLKGLAHHISCIHKITTKKYYDKYLKEKDEEKCKVCGKQKRFLSISNGYNGNYCSLECQHKDPDYLDKIKKALNSKKARAKARKTLLEKTGYEYALSDPSVHKKARKTKKRLYGDENYNNREKAEKTNLKRYNAVMPLLNPKIKKKSIKTSRKHWGADHYLQSEKGLKYFQKEYYKKHHCNWAGCDKKSYKKKT